MRGTRNAARMKSMAGGIVSIIVVLFPHDEGPEDVFGGQHQGHACHESEGGIKPVPALPREDWVFVCQQFQDEQHQKPGVVDPKKPLHVSRLVKQILPLLCGTRIHDADPSLPHKVLKRATVRYTVPNRIATQKALL
jgi:hypothetical protein